MNHLPWHVHQWEIVRRLFERSRLPHAILLHGDSGLGKREFSQSLVKLLLCPDSRQQAPCGGCRVCRSIETTQTAPDLLTVSPEEPGKAIRIDQVRNINEFVTRTTHTSSLKVVRLYPTEYMLPAAANALLKTLEEPPDSTVFILISDSPGRLLATLRSRCQKIAFTLPPFEISIEWLRKQLPEADVEKALELAAGRPFAAIDLVKSGVIDVWSRIDSDLAALGAGSLSRYQFMQQREGVPIKLILLAFIRFSTTLIREQLVSQDTLKTSMRPHLGSQVKSRLSALVDFERQVRLAVRESEGASNVNQTLVLQSLVQQWMDLQNRT